MTNGQRQTTRVLLAFVFLVGLLCAGLLGWEFHSLSLHDHATISETLWLVWAKQPWAVFIVSHSLAAPFWFLLGHFFAQSADTYDRIRRDWR